MKDKGDTRTSRRYRFGSFVDLKLAHRAAAMDRTSTNRPVPQHLGQTGGCLFSGKAGSSMAMTPVPWQATHLPSVNFD
jgi:hypothetical protein